MPALGTHTTLDMEEARDTERCRWENIEKTNEELQIETRETHFKFLT